MSVAVHHGDCLDVLATLGADSIDAVVTDPPYHLIQDGLRLRSMTVDGKGNHLKPRPAGFMGQQWDGGDVAFRPDTWRAVLRVMKPGAYLVAFGGSRTSHRMACAIEDAGFELRDTLMWLYGSGFPKSRNIGNGWGTALKPAHEPIILARKPLGEATVAANVLRHGTGAINVDACRVAHQGASGSWGNGSRPGGFGDVGADNGGSEPCGQRHAAGRWPANVLHDGSPEVLDAFAQFGDKPTGTFNGHRNQPKTKHTFGKFDLQDERGHIGDTGTAARFYYAAKASKAERAGSKHPTIKPLALIRWLVRLITPPDGVCLDPFAGSGTTGHAAQLEHRAAMLIEREAAYIADIHRRLGTMPRKATPPPRQPAPMPLFDWIAA